LLASRLTRYLVPALLGLMRQNARELSRATGKAVDWPGLVPLLVKSGLASENIDRDALRDVAADFRGVDFALYSEQLKALGRHDARDLLPSIDVPVLIMTGDRDLMTPVFTARKMNRLIAGSRLIVLPGGTHYTPLEFGAEVGSELRRFVGSIRGFQVAEAA
jgi:pimeloyl-ACP methyl ester carboxylesterase